MQQQQQQIHADGSLRHAEKRRIGTCQFANRIARISLDAYESCVPQSYRDCHKQTCVAAIVAHYNNQNDDSNADNDDGATSGATTLSNRTHSNLQVIGLGVGTKFLPDAAIREEEQQNQNANTTTYSDNGNISSLETQYGTRIRDCHAEVLARRAFRRQLALEIMDDLKKNDNNEKESAAETATKNNNKNDDGKHGYLPILERIECNVGNSTNDGDSTECSVTNNKIRYRLRQDVTLHFYASSAPCGNATLKKFIKMEKEKFDTSLVS